MIPTLRILASGGPAVKLSAGAGGAILASDAGTPHDSTVAIRFNTDGTIETGTSVDGAAISWSSAGNWITPTNRASSDYDVRYTNLTNNPPTFTTEAAAEDVWVDLGTQRHWEWNLTTTLVDSFQADFEVRDGGGAPPSTASATWTFSIVNEV